MKTKKLKIHHQDFILHPSGALYWCNTDMLLIADVHLGKITHFRKHGVAVPSNAIQDNFDALDAVTSYFKPKVICFLGDLFHSYMNTEWLLFKDWTVKQEAKIVLIVGNHDVINPSKYEELQVHLSDEWLIGSILLTHHPEKRDNFFTICGHIHPGVQLQGLGRQYVRVPCFHKSVNQLVIPAFGTFTGTYCIPPTINEEIFAITENEVIEINFE
ncbi:ligase-associated DNA damage response endonuclease PdeM [Aquimarina addita]|uniref:Ligase-associated DNA damage response endonuclease PdeM n=1 Tax=Aquimarina addita TaxID=870485 RepID=A0ABP7X7Y3_9FLAO